MAPPAGRSRLQQTGILAQRSDDRRRDLGREHRHLREHDAVLALESRRELTLAEEPLGALFEQYVGLELLRASRQIESHLQLRFWRDPDGPEVDWVLVAEDRWLPVEVKWTDAPTRRDARHLETFLAEYRQAQEAIIICRTPRPLKLGRKITALPWQELPTLPDRVA